MTVFELYSTLAKQSTNNLKIVFKHLPRILLIIIILCFANSCTKARWSKTELDSIKSRDLWSYSFSDAVSNYHISPRGMAIVDLENDERWILEGKTGAPLWQTKKKTGFLLSDSDPALILELREKTHSLVAVSHTGQVIWEQNSDEVFIANAVNKETGIVVIASTSLNSQSGAKARVLKGLSLTSGKTLWEKQVAPPANDSGKIPYRTIRFVNNVSICILGNTAYGVDTSIGKILWSDSLDVTKTKGFIDTTYAVSWNHMPNIIVAALGPNIIGLSAENGVLWNTRIHSNAVIHRILSTPHGIAIGYHMLEGSGVALLEPDTGKITWQHEEFGEKDNENVLTSRIYGLSYSENYLIFSAARQLIAVNAINGKRLYAKPIKKDDYIAYRKMTTYNNKLILTGDDRIEARSLETGEQTWKQGPFPTPLSWRQGIEKTTSIIMAGAGGFAQGMAIGMGENQFSSQPSQLMLEGRAYSSMAGIYMLQVPESRKIALNRDLKDRSIEINSAWFLEAAHGSKWAEIRPGDHGYVVLVDYESGKLRRYPLTSRKWPCVVYAVANLQSNLVLVSYINVPYTFYSCEDSLTVDMLRLR